MIGKTAAPSQPFRAEVAATLQALRQPNRLPAGRVLFDKLRARAQAIKFWPAPRAAAGALVILNPQLLRRMR